MTHDADPPDTAPPSTASASSHQPELTTLPPARDVVRNAGRAVLSVHHWRARFVLWTAAVAVGVVAVAFARLADVAQLGLRRLLVIASWCPWILAPLCFCGIAWLTRRYFR